MAWAYVDDHFDQHHKVVAAGELDPLAPWLYVCGLTYAKRAATGGLIQNVMVKTLTPLYRPRARKALVTVALWDELGNRDIQIHNYTKWNKTSEERSASARNAAQVRWSKDKDIQGKVTSLLMRGQCET